MIIPRRQFLHLATGSAALSVISCASWAQTYPSRPVRWIVGFAPGSTTDITARVMGQRLSERLGQPFTVENRPGAGSNLATAAVVNSPPDGYTLLLVSTPHAINATLYEKLNFNFIRDIVPIASFYSSPLVMVVNPSVPARTVPEFISYAKANPGKISMASSGNGTGTHVSGELFKTITGIEITHVPYRGDAPALTDLIGGQVQVMFSNLPSSIEFIKTGKLRALAVTTAMRAKTLPDVPTVGDYLSGYEASVWYGVGAPKSTPVEIVNKLNGEVNAALADAAIVARIAELGGVPIPMTPGDFAKFIAEDTNKWAKVVRSSGARPD